jgi:hypothetical protein
MSDAACLFERQPWHTLATIGWGRGQGEGAFEDGGTREMRLPLGRFKCKELDHITVIRYHAPHDHDWPLTIGRPRAS